MITAKVLEPVAYHPYKFLVSCDCGWSDGAITEDEMKRLQKDHAATHKNEREADSLKLTPRIEALEAALKDDAKRISNLAADVARLRQEKNALESGFAKDISKLLDGLKADRYRIESLETDWKRVSREHNDMFMEITSLNKKIMEYTGIHP